jgi:uncharacterized protein YgbK (DUF1537 family)
MSAADAQRAVRDAVRGRPGVPHIFLKTDSTLRGRITASVRSLMTAYPDRGIVYAPAYPALGRTVRGGLLLVDGVPLAQTSFAHDPLNPARESSIARVLGEVGDCVTICDGECDADLQAAAARAAASRAIAAGTAAFARYWARTLPVVRTTAAAIPRAAGGLIVLGSRHPVSVAQVLRAEAAGLPGWSIHRTPAAMRGDPLQVAADCGAAVRAALDRSPAEALVVFGGDTAAAILEALECRVAHPCGELVPGVPVSRVEALGRSFVLVTKAGGFGDDETLLRIVSGIGRAS